MNFVLIVLCLFTGYILRRTEILQEGAHKGLNAWLIYLAIPGVTFLYVPKITWSPSLLLPLATPILVFAGAFLVLKRLESDHRPRQGALLLSCALGNTSFVGFPLTEAYFGHEGLSIAVICDQMSFLLLATLGVTLAITYGQGSNQKKIVQSLFRFPPFLAFLLALITPKLISSYNLPTLWHALSATLVPVALFSVGVQLKVHPQAFDRTLAWGLFYKLMIAPAGILALFWLIGAKGLPAQVSVLEAGMASMTTASVIAVEYGLDGELSSLLIGVGVPLSLITTYVWWKLSLSLL